MKYEVRFTTQFRKDIKLAKRQGRDIDKLFDIVNMLADGKPLDGKHRDYELTGNYKGCRECHIDPDWLLIYEINNEILILLLNRVGSHSELFR